MQEVNSYNHLILPWGHQAEEMKAVTSQKQHLYASKFTSARLSCFEDLIIMIFQWQFQFGSKDFKVWAVSLWSLLLRAILHIESKRRTSMHGDWSHTRPSNPYSPSPFLPCHASTGLVMQQLAVTLNLYKFRRTPILAKYAHIFWQSLTYVFGPTSKHSVSLQRRTIYIYILYTSIQVQKFKV